MGIGERLKHLRLEMNLKQEDMAKYLDVHRATYGKYELEERDPSTKDLVKLADFFDVSLDYILRGKPDLQQEKIIVREIPVISKLSPEKRDLFQNIEYYKAAILPSKDVEKYFYYLVTEDFGKIGKGELILMEKTSDLIKNGIVLLLIDNKIDELNYVVVKNSHYNFISVELNFNKVLDTDINDDNFTCIAQAVSKIQEY